MGFNSAFKGLKVIALVKDMTQVLKLLTFEGVAQLESWQLRRLT